MLHSVIRREPWIEKCFRHIWKRSFILGIETSCDDTGAAVFSLEGELMGESLRNQVSTRYGGVIPSLAMGKHARALPVVVSEALTVPISKISAVAVSNRPGLRGSLSAGVDYAKYICLKHRLPLIPIHHMEAHTLTPRMKKNLTFPYLFLLMSGGHCILGIAERIDSFLILGTSPDSPGEALDKVARALRLHTQFSEFREVSGGESIERMGCSGDPLSVKWVIPLSHKKNCQFSFSGLKSSGVEKARLFDDFKDTNALADFCASYQFTIGKHICMRLQRAMDYINLKDLLQEKKLVVSGGVARNETIRSYLNLVASAYGYETFYPEPKYCSDNGVMIAWNGLEKFRENFDIVPTDNVLSVSVFPESTFGTNISQDIENLQISCKWIKIA